MEATHTEQLAEFKKYLSKGIEALGLDAEVLGDYILGGLEAASKASPAAATAEQQQEQQQQLQREIKETLSLSLEDPSPELQERLEAFCCSCAERWVQQVLHAAQQQEQQQRQQDLNAILLSAAAAAAPADEGHEDETARRIRERVVQQYGYEIDEMVECDEEGNLKLQASSSSSSSKKQGDDPGIWCNDNRARVQQASRAARARAKAEHEMEVQRNKQQQLLQQQRMEKEKQRVAKKERKAGR